MRRKFSERTRSHKGFCENLIDALRLLATIRFTDHCYGLARIKRESILNGLRRFVDLDNHIAVERAICAKALRTFKDKKRK